jgi:hypothetical protein
MLPARRRVQSADESQDSFTKQYFLDAGERWLCLAHSYEFAERLSNFTEPAVRSQKTRKPQKLGVVDGPSFPVGELQMSGSQSILGQPKGADHGELV